jgi:hypothetical protein
MRSPLFTDLKKDKNLINNLLRVCAFLILVIVLDYAISIFLQKGIEVNYGIKSNSEILLIGHSHLMLALDKVSLEKHTGFKIAKYTREGVNVSDRYIMLKHYFFTCTEMPKIVVLGIDPWEFTSEGLSKNSYRLFLPFMDTPEVNKYIKGSVSSEFENFEYKFIRCSRFNSSMLNASIRGYLRIWKNLKFGIIDSGKIRKEIINGVYRKIGYDKSLIDDFSKTMLFLKEKKVDVILLNTPIFEPLLSVQSMDYMKVLHIADSIAISLCPRTYFVDLVPQFSTKSNLFFDPIHLNPDGQEAVTDYFAKIVDSIQIKNNNFRISTKE